uniref:ATP synthase subunit g n=1 Tax=Megaselia scalaris TaxID=36166 RepID=T1GKJ3_MEGSC
MAKLAKKLPGIWNELSKQVKPKLEEFWKYAKVELTPPAPNEIPEIAKGVKNIVCTAVSGRWKQITVREAWLNTLVVTEVGLWFYIGECIGKRHLVGYNV